MGMFSGVGSVGDNFTGTVFGEGAKGDINYIDTFGAYAVPFTDSFKLGGKLSRLEGESLADAWMPLGRPRPLHWVGQAAGPVTDRPLRDHDRSA
jgi:hypothetical protein